MHPWPSCNGRTRNAVSMSIWVYTRPHYFYCPSPDFSTSIVSQSVTNNRCAPSCGGTIEKWGGTSKKIRPALRAGIVPPPLANCFRRHWNRPQLFDTYIALFMRHLTAGVTKALYACSVLVQQINANKRRPPANAGYFRVHSRLYVCALPALCKMYDVTLNWPRYFTRYNNYNILRISRIPLPLSPPLCANARNSMW